MEQFKKENDNSEKDITAFDYKYNNSDLLPKDLTEQQLKTIREGLEQSVAFYKKNVKDGLMYSVPLAPVLGVINSSSVDRNIDILAGLTGANIPIGFAEAVTETVELLKTYKNLLKIRKEIRVREKIERESK